MVATTPGGEGKWLAAAKSAGLYDETIEQARIGILHRDAVKSFSRP